MLYSIDSDREINTIPHVHDYRRWRKGLTNDEYQAIFDALTQRITDSDIETSSWIPGSNWIGTVYQPIWEKACDKDSTAAAKFFGLILWHVVMLHPDCWAFGRYKLNGIPIEGLTYFRITR